MTYRFLPHTADIRVAIEATSFEGLFEDATIVMRGLLAGEHRVEPREKRHVSVSGADPAELFLGYLQELLYLFDTEAFLPASVAPERLTESEAVALVLGETYEPSRHEHQPEVKAVTRHGLVVERRDDGWRAEVVFDV